MRIEPPLSHARHRGVEDCDDFVRGLNGELEITVHATEDQDPDAYE